MQIKESRIAFKRSEKATGESESTKNA